MRRITTPEFKHMKRHPLTVKVLRGLATLVTLSADRKFSKKTPEHSARVWLQREILMSGQVTPCD